jgi:hypothetical protein
MINKNIVKVGWDNLNTVQYCDIVSVKTPRDLMSKATRIAQRRQFEQESWASHTGVIVDRTLEDKVIVNEALWRVTERPLDDYKGKSQVCIARFPINNLIKKYTIIEDLKSRIGAKYGWWKLFHHLFGRQDIIKNINRPICSYHVAQAFSKAGFTFGVPAWQAQPDDILDYVLYNSQDSLVWCDSEKTLQELVSIYNTDDYVKELKAKIGV